MSKFHATVSRRDFMKGIGLAGAGIGAAVATAPVFHDVDEMIAQSPGLKRPWYVKELDYGDSTVEIDWGMMQRRTGTFKDPYGGGKIYKDELYKNSTSPEAEAARASGIGVKSYRPSLLGDEVLQQAFPDWRTGNARDYALGEAAYSIRKYFNPGKFGGTDVEGCKRSLLPEQVEVRSKEFPEVLGEGVTVSYGLTKWTDTPENNLAMLQVAARHYGARDLGVLELDGNTKKLLYKDDPGGRRIVLDTDDAMPVVTDTEIRIPSRFKYMIAMAQPNSHDVMKSAPYHLSCAAQQQNCGPMSYYRTYVMQEFIRALGWTALATPSANPLWMPAAAIDTLAGMGEHCRVGGATNSPDFGTASFRNYLITDLPLAPTKPIDAGIFKFCETCKICADLCPVGALSMDGPSWEGSPDISPSLLDVPFAHKGYHFNSYRCYKCSRCQTVCPFTSKREAMIHDLVLGTIATTSAFNSFLVNMDKVFGYDEISHPDDFWGSLPPMFGINPQYNQ